MEPISSRVIKLTVITDIICPYCYVGYREILDAMSACQTMQLPIEFEVEYKPFRLLNCLDEKTSVEKVAFWQKKLGAEHTEHMKKTVLKWAEEKGLNIKFGGVLSQTTRAHRLSWKAYLKGGQRMQLRILDGIFKAFWEQERDIGDVNVLAELAEDAKMMSREEALRFLESDELHEEVIKSAEASRSKGISGVPVTVIDHKWVVEGGKSSDVYIQIFTKMASGLNASIPTTFTSPNIIGSCAKSAA